MSVSSSSASSPERDVAAVIVAGGSGRRMGGVRKQYLQLLGEPVLLRAIRPFLDHPRIGFTVVVLPPEDAASPPGWIRGLPVTVASGGAERSDSVWSGLERVPSSMTSVLIHDGARPLVTGEVIDRVIQGMDGGGALAAVQATDTIKLADARRRVERTIPRAQIWQAQTPQGFPLAPLRACYLRARAEGWTVTDDAEVYERCGLGVVVVPGDRENLKLTRPEDLPIAEAIVRRRLSDAPGVAHREG